MSDNKFSYTYSSPTEKERREIESIKRQYSKKNDDEISIERLRYLDSKVKSLPQAISLAFGVVGLLIFGLGLALVLHWNIIALGILVCLTGVPFIALAYPIYTILLKRGKKKYGDEILRLSEELLKK